MDVYECIKTFNTQIAYNNNKKINIENYNGIDEILCKNNHKLCFVNSNKKIKYFRHINIYNDYNDLWHKSFQDNFDNIEIYFKKKTLSISSRKADILINNFVIELQHSHIKIEEVNNRNYDYSLYDKKVIWIVDGNMSINVIYLPINNSYLLMFKDNLWKYESFINCEYIYLDINNKIYRINPINVKSKCIQVLDFKIKEDFINEIKNDILEWNCDRIPQTTLYYNQRGAGCGKTYESIQLLASKEEFQEKNLFIYLTKVHSAKDNIYNEFKEQIQEKKLNIDEYTDIDKKYGNQYKFDIKINNRKIKIIIGTIDSFIYALGDKSKTGMNFFTELLNSIKNDYIGYDKYGNIKYSGENVKLSKESLIIIDETQDLEEKYIEALMKIMKNTYIDVYLIGDKLQSIWYANNIYTYLENIELPDIRIIKNQGENIVRRFHNNKFQDFVNDVIKFENFNLPKICGCCDIKNCKYNHENHKKPYEIFHQPKIYSNDFNIKKIADLCEDIINKVKEKVEEYNYLPNNFMFIFPIMKNNYLANILSIYLKEYWNNKFHNKNFQDNILKNNEYWKNKINYLNSGKPIEFVFIHKSDDNKPINLNESENMTKFLTIHSSKGLGCEVIFLLNLNQNVLEILSKDDNELKLKYNSLLHVSITRQKKYIYIGIDNDNVTDDIYSKFESFGINNNKDEDLFLDNIIKLDTIIINI